MTKIRPQDNSTEDDDDTSASEHYDEILPMSSSIASADYEFHTGSLRSDASDLYGKEASSEAKEDNLWSHYSGLSSERPHVSEVGMLGHPWTDIPTVTSRKDTMSLVPKNMFGRSVAAVLHSPDLLEPCFESLPSPPTYPHTQSGPSPIIATDHSQSGHHPSSSLDVGIEEVRRHFGDGLHLAGNLQITTEPITSAQFSVLESQGPRPAVHSSANLTEAANQEEIVEGPIAGRSALSFVPGRSIEGSASLSEPCPSPLEELCLPTHTSTQQNNVSIFSAASPNLPKSVEGHLEDSAAINGFSRQRFSPASPEDQDSGSDHEERRNTSRHPGKRSDKRKAKKIYRCAEPWCQATFTRSNDAERHRLSAAVHKRANKDSSTCCQKCGEELSRPDARKRHELKGSCGKRKINRKPPHPLAST